MSEHRERRITNPRRKHALSMVAALIRGLGVDEAGAAELLGVNHKSIQNWRARRFTPAPTTIKRMAEAFEEAAQGIDQRHIDNAFAWRMKQPLPTSNQEQED